MSKLDNRKRRTGTVKDEDDVEQYDSWEIGRVRVSEHTYLLVRGFTGRDGKKRVDLRQWVESANYTGPTKKGVNLPAENIHELKVLLEFAQAQLTGKLVPEEQKIIDAVAEASVDASKGEEGKEQC